MKLCRKLYFPKKQLSVGKSLALFKCQLHFKQYITTKREGFRINFINLHHHMLYITLNFSVNSRKRMFHNGNESSNMAAPESTPFYYLRL